MSVVIRSASRRTSSSTSSISRAFIRSDGVAVLADAREREHAPRLELELALVLLASSSWSCVVIVLVLVVVIARRV